MATVVATDLGDLVAGTLRDLGRLSFQNIAQEVQDYEVFTKWFKKDKVAFESGIGIQRTLMNKIQSVAAHVGLTDTDSVNIPDLLTTMQVDWRHMSTNWAFIYQEALMNRGRALILNIIEPRRYGALLDMVNTIEEKAWGSPPSSSNKTLPWGVQYWVVPNATTGFNGGAASGHTTVANVSLTDSPNFKNYTAQYATVSKTDLVKKLRTAHRKVRFKSPINYKDYRQGRGDRYRLYVNESVISDIEDIGEGQNENLGRDIASMDGTMVFRGHPIIWVPELDSNTADPVYMLDHSTFYPVVLRGDFLRESQAERAPNQHNIFQFFVDLTYNYVCVDRRRNAVLSTTTF